MAWEHEAYDTWTRGSFDVSIHLDHDARNPLEAFDPMGKFIVTGSTRNYSGLGTAQLEDYGLFQSYGSYFHITPCNTEIEVDEDDVPAMLEKLTGGVVYQVTLQGYSQSEWAEGLFVVTRDELIEEYGADARGRLRTDAKRKARKYLEGQAEELKNYFSGDVFGYVIEHDGEHIDSCWGFYGIEHVTEAANEAVDILMQNPQYQASQAA